jgi:hypothetical protein
LTSAPLYPQFRHATDKVFKAPDNSYHSSTGPSLNHIGPARRLRGWPSWGVHVMAVERIYRELLVHLQAHMGHFS